MLRDWFSFDEIGMATELALPAIQRGDTVPFTFTFTNGVSAIDMRGRTLIMSLKLSAYATDAEASLTKQLTVAVDDTDGEDGIVEFRFERSETVLLVPGVTYAYSVRTLDTASPENIETTLLYGELPVEDA